MNKNTKKRYINHVIYAGVFSLYVIFLQVTKIYSPITYLFNIPTPTTGTTRALISFIQGDIQSAFHKHPLFWLAPFFGINMYLLLLDKKKKNLYISLICAIIYFITYLIRLYTGNIFY